MTHSFLPVPIELKSTKETDKVMDNKTKQKKMINPQNTNLRPAYYELYGNEGHIVIQKPSLEN